MALREVLAELDVVIKGAPQLQAINITINQFVTNAQHAAPAADRAGAAIDDVGEKAKKAQPKTHSFAETMAGVRDGLIAVWLATEGARRATGFVTDVIHEVIELGDELGDTSERMGLSADSLAQWRYVAQRTGVDATELDGALRLFNQTLGRASRGGAQAAAFRSLGVAIRGANGELRPTEEVLNETILRLSEIRNPTERAAEAMRLFGRSGLAIAQIAGRDSEELQRLTSRWRELTGGGLGDFVERAGEADEALTDLDATITALKVALSVNVLPAITRTVTLLAEWGGQLNELINTSSIFQAVMLTLGVVLGILAVTLLIVSLPLIAVLALLAGLVLVVEDVITAFRGGNSVFGTLIEQLFEMMGITITFQGHLESWGVAWAEMSARAQEAFRDILVGVRDVQEALGIDLVEGLDQTIVQASVRAVSARHTANVEQMGFRSRENERFAAREAAQPAAPQIAGRTGRRGSGTVAGRNVAQTNNIEINGARDPQAVGREVDRVLRRRAREAAEGLPVAAAGAT